VLLRTLSSRGPTFCHTSQHAPRTICWSVGYQTTPREQHAALQSGTFAVWSSAHQFLLPSAQRFSFSFSVNTQIAFLQQSLRASLSFQDPSFTCPSAPSRGALRDPDHQKALHVRWKARGLHFPPTVCMKSTCVDIPAHMLAHVYTRHACLP
jgi:hypothetical protein